MPGRVPTVLFDLDGTLVDSQADIVNSFLHAFDTLDLPRPGRADVVAAIGRPLEEMYADFAPSEYVTRLADAYRAHYPLHFTDTTAAYAGVPELLGELKRRGYARAVATTKRSAMARDLVAAVGLGGHLEHVQGTDGFPAKPAPDVIERALAAVGGAGGGGEGAGAGAVGVVMVGDTAGDILAGRAAGLATYGVTWGSGTAEVLTAAGADVVAPDLGRLLELLGER